MPVANIVDGRTNKYNINCDVVFEASYHDNRCKDATQFPIVKDGIGCEDMESTTIEKAIEAGISCPVPLTLYLYDTGQFRIDYSYEG